jgi:CheY-like chemotaxis protein
VISGYADLIATDASVGEAHLRRVDAIRKAAERSSRLTAQLLAFSRKQLLQPEPLHLGAVVSALAPTLRRMIPEDIELLTDDRDGDVRVFADRAQAEQAIFNLCSNARDAMQGGGRLVLATACADVDAAAAEGRGTPGRYAVLRVSDTGAGMDEATASRVFDPFFTTKPVGHGTGLGLAMVYGFAQQSGGWVTVDTVPGAGSTFTVYLPASDREDDAPLVSPVEGGASRGTETILVVEDDPFVRELEVETLSRHGYRVIASEDTEHAMLIARELDQRIDLLLTDVVMPGMSGPELSARVCELRPGLEVLYVSGYSENAVVDRGVVRSGTHLLTKPFAPDDLARMVRRLLDRRGTASGSE